MKDTYKSYRETLKHPGLDAVALFTPFAASRLDGYRSDERLQYVISAVARRDQRRGIGVSARHSQEDWY